jgi:hypothetical protein
MGRPIPDFVWAERKLQEQVGDFLSPPQGFTREDAWGLLEEETERLMQLVGNAKVEALEEIESSVSGGGQMVREAPPREHEREQKGVETASFVNPKTTAMLRAMCELFALLANRYPEVVTFREEVLGGRLLTEREANELLASYAARFFTPEEFSDWGIPVVGHVSELVQYDDCADKDEIDHRATVQVNPPGITKTVRYAYHREEASENTRCALRAVTRTIVPPNERVTLGPVPIHVIHGEYWYPPFLWPLSVVDILYNLAEDLAKQFDWSESPELDDARNHAAALFILTGKVPEVHPIDVRWMPRVGRRVKPPKRIQLTIPPWLTEREVLRAYQQMREQTLGSTTLPKTTTPLEVASFVWEQERSNDNKRPPWDVLRQRWNKEHPGSYFETYNHFRTYFKRGEKAVKALTFVRLRSDKKSFLSEVSDALYEALDDNPHLRKIPAEELAQQLVLGGYLDQQPSSELINETLEKIGAEE